MVKMHLQVARTAVGIQAACGYQSPGLVGTTAEELVTCKRCTAWLVRRKATLTASAAQHAESVTASLRALAHLDTLCPDESWRSLTFDRTTEIAPGVNVWLRLHDGVVSVHHDRATFYLTLRRDTTALPLILNFHAAEDMRTLGKALLAAAAAFDTAHATETHP